MSQNPTSGYRDNGLTAPTYTLLEDLDPRVAARMLDELATAEIAAYVQPAADIIPGAMGVTLPSVPLDRLFVDREERQEARRILREVTDPFADDEVEPETAEEADDAAAPDALDEPAAWRGTTTDQSLLDILDEDFPENVDEHFTPPPPPPLPRLAPPTLLALGGIALGILLLFRPKFLGLSNDVMLALGLVVLMGGFFGLVWRLRNPTGDEDPDPDDGARV